MVPYRRPATNVGRWRLRDDPCSRPNRGRNILDPLVEQNPLHLLVRRIAAHRPLSSDDRAAILDLPYKLRKLEAQAYTMREGDRPDRCAVLLSGYAFRHKLTGEGARQILSIHIPGEALDFQNMFLEESDHNVQMLTRGLVAELARGPLEQLVLGNANVGRAIL